MAAISYIIPQIRSWTAVAAYATKPLAPNTLKIFAVDMDFTLVYREGLGSSKWLDFFRYANQKWGLSLSAYDQWAEEVCKLIPYKACESSKIINAILKIFREHGWLVKVLTARSSLSHKITQRHLKEAKLDLELEDVIFTRCLNMFPKDVVLKAWIKRNVNLKLYEQMELLFLD
ncbi:MAG: hypothetical protein K2X08_01465, partial [Chlamydiales bacterium]|nr:hypothetical protein [Chlamydiales bacterium]